MNKEIYLTRSLFIDTNKNNIQDQYEFKKELGRGAYGKVYLAKNKHPPHRLCAVKELPKSKVKYVRAIHNEVEILKKLDHPNIVKIYQTYEDEKHFYIVTDYCEGGQLFDRLATMGSFSQNDARQIFLQVLYAIKYCHNCKICHRDLKPENFLLQNSQDLTIKLIDFGLSFKWKQNIKEEMMNQNQNRLVGTSYYVAPEVIHKDYNEKCDLWSLGVILYILLTGVPPFDGANDKLIIQSVKKGNFTFHIPEFKNVSKEVKDLIGRILVEEKERISIEDIYNHPWITKDAKKTPLHINYNKISKFIKFSKLKTYAVACIVSQLSGKEIQKLSQLFNQLDVNHDGFISTQELRKGLSKQKEDISVEEIEKLMNFIDTDHNGKINYSEFIACCLENSIIFREENLVRVFQTLDRDKNGLISIDELKYALKKSENNQQLDDVVIDEIMQACDKNKDGVIDFKEFLNSLTQIS